MSTRFRIPAWDVPRETRNVVGAIGGAHFANHMYLVLLPPILSVLADEFGVSIAALGFALGAQGVTNTGLQLPYGYLADNYDRTLALALSSALGGVGAVLVALAPTYAWLVVGLAVLGAGIGGHHPSHYPIIADATPEEQRGRAYSIYSLGGNLGFATPPALLTLVMNRGFSWRHGVGLIGVAGLLYAGFLTLYFSRRVGPSITEPNETESTDAGVTERLRAGLRSIAASPGVLGISLLTFVTSTAKWGFTAYVVILLTRAYGVGLDTANLALTGAFVVGAGAVLIGGYLTDRAGAGAVMLGSFAALALVTGTLATRAATPLLAVGLVLVAGAIRSISPPARARLTDRLSARGDVGKNFAVITVGIMLGNAVAPPLYGWVIDHSSAETAFYAVAGTAVLAVGITAAVLVTYLDADRVADAAAES
ncbi:MAG: MFS transporter [Haloferacaceae archaeon]